MDLVLQTFIFQLHSPGFTSFGSGAALSFLRFDTIRNNCIRFQLDVELFRRYHGQWTKRVISEERFVVTDWADSLSNKPKLRGDKKKAIAFCFTFFAVSRWLHSRSDVSVFSQESCHRDRQRGYHVSVLQDRCCAYNVPRAKVGSGSGIYGRYQIFDVSG